jgi:unsaturated rhamnogalacturonyl hydrolase
LLTQVARASLIYKTKAGVVAASGGAPVDPLMIGEGLWHAARVSGDQDLRKAADDLVAWALKGAPRDTAGIIYHTGESFWSDSFNTSPPLLACSGHGEEAIRQIEGQAKRLWNADQKLVSHIWDEKKQQFQDKSFWGGGCGWMAAGLTRVIRALPDDKKVEKQKLAATLKDLIDGCLSHQRADGLFYNVVDDPNTFVETDLSQMLAFSIYESVRGGWLPAAYLPAADKMRAAAMGKVDKYGFVQGVAGAPDFNHPGISPEGQAFFLMMEAAAQKLKLKASQAKVPQQ